MASIGVRESVLPVVLLRDVKQGNPTNADFDVVAEAEAILRDAPALVSA